MTMYMFKNRKIISSNTEKDDCIGCKDRKYETEEGFYCIAQPDKKGKRWCEYENKV